MFGRGQGTNYFDFDASVNAKLSPRQDKMMLLAQGLSRPEVASRTGYQKTLCGLATGSQSDTR